MAVRNDKAQKLLFTVHLVAYTVYSTVVVVVYVYTGTHENMKCSWLEAAGVGNMLEGAYTEIIWMFC